MFIFLDSRKQNKRFETEWQKAFFEINLVLSSMWMQFWLVTVIYKYFNVFLYGIYIITQ
jgi:hypothetical protein